MNLHTEGLASYIHAQIVQCGKVPNYSALILSQCKLRGVDPLCITGQSFPEIFSLVVDGILCICVGPYKAKRKERDRYCNL